MFYRPHLNMSMQPESASVSHTNAEGLGVAGREQGGVTGEGQADGQCGQGQPDVFGGRPCFGKHLKEDTQSMFTFLLWLLLFVLCWPLALLALVLWPIVWLISLPFRLLGIAVDGAFSLLRAMVMLPARVLGGRAR